MNWFWDWMWNWFGEKDSPPPPPPRPEDMKDPRRRGAVSAEAKRLEDERRARFDEGLNGD
jgi:hypothetical protein